MKKLISTTAIAALSIGLPAIAQAQTYYEGQPYNAHEACKKNEDKRQIIGGLAGAVLGGVIGSQVSGNGARTEGSAIGAVVGGAAGYGIADKTVDCDPVYPDQSYGSEPYRSSSHSGGYTTVSQPQPVYDDRVTYSNHPVYTQPAYGAGAVSYGTTYNTGTTTYPPYTNQPAQSYQVASPSYQTGSSYGSQNYGSGSSYQTAPAPTYHDTRYVQPVRTAPSYTTTTYARPVSYNRTGYAPRHYHGSYTCHDRH